MQLSRGQHTIKLTILWETAHLDGIFQGRVTIDNGSIRAATDVYQGQVDIGRKAAVKSQLFPAIVVALGQCRKIEETEIKRFFDFVGEVSSEENPRYVSLDQRHLGHRVIIESWLAHGPDYPGVLFCVHRPTP